MANGNIPGSGTIGDPYLIEDEADLLALRGKSSSSPIYVEQTTDIVVSTVISFALYNNTTLIYYNGNNHTIEDLNYTASTSAGLYLFRNANITNLKFLNLKIKNTLSGGPVYGIANTLAFAKNLSSTNFRIESNGSSYGVSFAVTNIEDCHFQGSILGSSISTGIASTGSVNGKTIRTSVDVVITSGSASTGFYYDANNHLIQDCHAHVEIDATSFGAGISYNNGQVNRCYVTGYIRGGGGVISGIVGTLSNASSYVHNSFCLLDYIQRRTGTSPVYDIGSVSSSSPPDALKDNYTINTFKTIDSGGVPIP